MLELEINFRFTQDYAITCWTGEGTVKNLRMPVCIGRPWIYELLTTLPPEGKLLKANWYGVG